MFNFNYANLFLLANNAAVYIINSLRGGAQIAAIYADRTNQVHNVQAYHRQLPPVQLERGVAQRILLSNTTYRLVQLAWAAIYYLPQNEQIEPDEHLPNMPLPLLLIAAALVVGEMSERSPLAARLMPPFLAHSLETLLRLASGYLAPAIAPYAFVTGITGVLNYLQPAVAQANLTASLEQARLLAYQPSVNMASTASHTPSSASSSLTANPQAFSPLQQEVSPSPSAPRLRSQASSPASSPSSPPNYGSARQIPVSQLNLHRATPAQEAQLTAGYAARSASPLPFTPAPAQGRTPAQNVLMSRFLVRVGQSPIVQRTAQMLVNITPPPLRRMGLSIRNAMMGPVLRENLLVGNQVVPRADFGIIREAAGPTGMHANSPLEGLQQHRNRSVPTAHPVRTPRTASRVVRMPVEMELEFLATDRVGGSSNMGGGSVKASNRQAELEHSTKPKRRVANKRKSADREIGAQVLAQGSLAPRPRTEPAVRTPHRTTNRNASGLMETEDGAPAAEFAAGSSSMGGGGVVANKRKSADREIGNQEPLARRPRTETTTPAPTQDSNRKAAAITSPPALQGQEERAQETAAIRRRPPRVEAQAPAQELPTRKRKVPNAGADDPLEQARPARKPRTAPEPPTEHAPVRRSAREATAIATLATQNAATQAPCITPIRRPAPVEPASSVAIMSGGGVGGIRIRASMGPDDLEGARRNLSSEFAGNDEPPAGPSSRPSRAAAAEGAAIRRATQGTPRGGRPKH